MFYECLWVVLPECNKIKRLKSICLGPATAPQQVLFLTDLLKASKA